jgi:hypothetical protein
MSVIKNTDIPVACVPTHVGLPTVGEIKKNGINYLYIFNVEAHSVGAVPAEIVTEWWLTAYEIADVGGAKGKVLRKLPADGNKTWCFFNSYWTFVLPIVARFHFYFDSIASFGACFGINLLDNSSGGWRVVWFYRDAGTGQARFTGYRVRTDINSLIVEWAQNIVTSAYDYKIPVNTTTLYIFETWLDKVDGKPRARVSADNGITRSDTVKMDATYLKNRVGYVDWFDGWARTIQIKKVEVFEQT